MDVLKSMKLIFCPSCQDLFKLHTENKSCCCGKSHGHYEVDEVNAVVGGQAIAVGVKNSSFIEALKIRPSAGWGQRFEAFVIPKKCPTVRTE